MANGFGSNNPANYQPSQTTEYQSYNDYAGGYNGRVTADIPKLQQFVPFIRWAQNPKALADLSRRHKVRLPGTRPDNDEPTLIWGRAASFDDPQFTGYESSRETETVRVTNPDDPEMYIDVVRIKSITFQNAHDNKYHYFELNW